MPQSSNRRLLLISYLFPPAGGVAVQRALSLARYLPRYGCDVTVLAAANPATPVVDESLVRLIPPSVRVERTFSPEIPFEWRQRLWKWLKRLGGDGNSRAAAGGAPQQAAAPPRPGILTSTVQSVLCPDPEVVWKPFALRTASRLIAEQNIDTILVTAPPFSAFLTGVALKKRFPHLRLVSDFRDSWLNFYLSTFDFLQNDSVRRRSEAMEREVVETSDLVVTVTHSIVDELRGRYTGQPPGKFARIVNGFDPEVFASFRPRAHGTGKIIVSYLGTVYPAGSARYYLRALESLPAEEAARFETRFFGRITPAEQPYIDAHKSSTIRTYGFLPQEKALEFMEETDFVLVTMTDPASLTGKILEYLAMNKPILGFSPPGGEVERVLIETGTGWCAGLDSVEQGREILRKAQLLVDGQGARLERNQAAIDRYDRAQLAGEYAALIHQQPARR